MKKIIPVFSAIVLLSFAFVSCKKDSLSDPASQLSETAKRKSSGGTTTSTSAPSVSFISPANGSTVTGTINVQVAASSSVGIKSTSLMITVGTSNCLFANDATAPYEFSWNTNYTCLAPIAPGTKVTLRATATDNNGKTSYTDIAVTKQ